MIRPGVEPASGVAGVAAAVRAVTPAVRVVTAAAVACVALAAGAVAAPAVDLSNGLCGSIYYTIILSNSASTASLHIFCQAPVELLVPCKVLIISVPFCGRCSRINRYARQVIICCCKAISLRCSSKAS